MSETTIWSKATELERRGLRERVYDLVLDTLLTSRIEPGTRLSIDAIARDLDVSPTPVREALVLLERTGLVTREAHKGYRVAPPIVDEQLEALFDARVVLECGATKLVANRIDEALPSLTAALEEHVRHVQVMRGYREVGADGGPPTEVLRDYYAADWGFHHAIFEATSNPFLLDMSVAISSRVHRLRQRMATGISDEDEAIAEHQEILAAFSRGPEQAAQAMLDHIEKVRARSRRDALREGQPSS